MNRSKTTQAIEDKNRLMKAASEIKLDKGLDFYSQLEVVLKSKMSDKEAMVVINLFKQVLNKLIR